MLHDWWKSGARHTALCQQLDGRFTTDPQPAALLCGSFNPLHEGHQLLADVASRKLGTSISFELSIANVDKPELPLEEVERRLQAFRGYREVWLTRAPTFLEKARLFPGIAFVVGHDTAIRLIDPKYYGGEAKRDSALYELQELCSRFLVAGRVDSAGLFRVWTDNLLSLGEEISAMFEVIPETEFRVDISSTALRNATV